MRNLEAKFRLGDLDAARAAALGLGYAPAPDFIQRDTFFVVARGKLKLREQPPAAWLIQYERDRESGLMLSRYEIVPVADPERTREMLARALGVLAEVRKHRSCSPGATSASISIASRRWATSARSKRYWTRRATEGAQRGRQIPRARRSTNCSARSASAQAS